MSIYHHSRNLDLWTNANRQETAGVDMVRAIELARAAEACITLSDPDTEPFLSELPKDAADYHSYDDLTEIIWRTFLSRDDIKYTARTEPQSARSSAMYIWRQAVLCINPTKYRAMIPQYISNSTDLKVENSCLRRTVIGDEAMHGFYKGVKDGRIICGLAKRSVSYMEMLLAPTHPELLDMNWPDEIFEFMEGNTNVTL